MNLAEYNAECNNLNHASKLAGRGSLSLNTLLQVLDQVITSSTPLIVCIFTCFDHVIGCTAFTHFWVKSFAQIANWVTTAEAWQSTLHHESNSVDYTLHMDPCCQVALHT
jgi:hypothetical protein